MRSKGTLPIIIIVLSLLVLVLTACGEANRNQGAIVPFPPGGQAAAATPPATQNQVGSILASLPQMPTASPTAAVAPTPTPEPTATPLPTATPIPPTATPLPPTATPVPPTATPVPPTATPVPPTATPTPSAKQAAATGGKWIDVNLTTQKLVAYEGKKVIVSSLISSGVANHPTATGNFNIYVKLLKQRMVGGEGAEHYDLPDVPYVMYFYQDYGIHGTYWHHNFGHVMSHGCVNAPTPIAQTLYNWAPLGTPVTVHY
jgi:lipoprotein-anchoring transpeptidase ErfK/SrfK